MKASQFFISTLKEAPADAEVVSHQLMMRAGLITKGIPTFWDYISGKVRDITVQIKVLPITPELVGDYNDAAYRERFQLWINQLWQQKDQQLSALKQGVKQ